MTDVCAILKGGILDPMSETTAPNPCLSIESDATIKHLDHGVKLVIAEGGDWFYRTPFGSFRIQQFGGGVARILCVFDEDANEIFDGANEAEINEAIVAWCCPPDLT